ncbi:MAG TPA: universal stress protein [Polyangiales bacterium]|nr:universal stress protein [Polyangiales bacterium]
MFELKILFATDLEGDAGEIAAGIQFATRLARERAATLIIMHVVPIDAADGEANLYRAVDLASDRSRRALERLVPSDQGVPFRHALEVGKPEDRIAQFVERERVELLVMQMRVRSALQQMLGRSLVERLAQRVKCPLVTYRADSVPRPIAAPAPPIAASPEALAHLLDTRVNALLTWMHLQREAARCIAEQRSIRDAIASLCRNASDRVFIPTVRNLLELELSEHQRALGALGVEVIHAGETVLQLGGRARRDDVQAHFFSQLQRDLTATSVPLEGEVESAAPNGLILAAARVEEATFLVFALDARRDFLRILAQPGPDPSAETYAFDVHGLMLSNSRFPEQLRRIGLLPADPGAQTARRLRLCDPGCNLLTEPRSSSAIKPLTRMAAAATAGEDGCDWIGYRDYRGVEVIGAWRWLPDYGFGVAAEMDRAPA